jgi:hypothetical protein
VLTVLNRIGLKIYSYSFCVGILNKTLIASLYTVFKNTQNTIVVNGPSLSTYFSWNERPFKKTIGTSSFAQGNANTKATNFRGAQPKYKKKVFEHPYALTHT